MRHIQKCVCYKVDQINYVVVHVKILEGAGLDMFHNIHLVSIALASTTLLLLLAHLIFVLRPSRPITASQCCRFSGQVTHLIQIVREMYLNQHGRVIFYCYWFGWSNIHFSSFSLLLLHGLMWNIMCSSPNACVFGNKGSEKDF